MSLPLITHPEQEFDKLKKKGVSICAFLDTVRVRKDGTFSVRLRIIHERFPKYYSTKINLDKKQYLQIAPVNVKGDLSRKKNIIHSLLRKALSIIDKMDVFSFEAFESQFTTTKPSIAKDITAYYEDAITKYKRNNQLGTASNYELSLMSLMKFHKKGKLQFQTITADWLNDYESDMINVQNKSQTTVGFYLRPLRAIFNKAIEDKAISIELYPFGKRKYTIPAPRATKKALDAPELKILFESVPLTKEQQKAKDFWFFSYFSNGMNFKDIAYLKYQNVSGEIFQFRRAKTIRTDRSQAPVSVYINDFISSVFEKYGNPDKKPENLIFSIVSLKDSTDIQRNNLKNFVRFVNQHFKNYAHSLGVKENISTYWARHCFATHTIRKGGTLSEVQEAFSHQSIKSTASYFDGFLNDAKKEMSKRLMDFEP